MTFTQQLRDDMQARAESLEARREELLRELREIGGELSALYDAMRALVPPPERR